MRIGLDIGTTNSAASFWDGRASRMIELGEGINTILPSVVTIASGQVYVGQDAIEQGELHPEYCFRHFKRKLAEPWHDEEETGHQTVRGPDGLTHFRGPDGHTWSPVELSAYLIEALVAAANQRLQPHDQVTGAVICVPADFTRAQRDAVKEAGHMAGLASVDLMHEPTAAALYYGYDAKKARRIAVVDFGGGTVDLSIISTGNGLVDVLVTNGIRNLGGSDFDKRIASYMVNRWRQSSDQDLALVDSAMVKIMMEAEAAKKRLSEKQDTSFRVTDVSRSQYGVSEHMIFPLDRATFDEITGDLRERVGNTFKVAIADIRKDDPNFSVKDLHDVLLVGGMTRVPAVRDMVKAFFGRDPKRDAAPEQVVALGAALQAAILDGRVTGLTVADITSHAISIETVNGIASILVPRGTNYPLEDEFMLSNPDSEQAEISVRLMQGDGARADTCELLWATDIPITPGPEKSARLPLKLKIDASGRAAVHVGGQDFGWSAA